MTPSLNFEDDGLEDEPATVIEFTLLDLLVDGLVLGELVKDVLSPLFSLTLLARLGLGELFAELEPILLELELVEVEEGLLERPP